eukprot:Clim_evm2s96 gene=Clim_evmTU2s96
MTRSRTPSRTRDYEIEGVEVSKEFERYADLCEALGAAISPSVAIVLNNLDITNHLHVDSTTFKGEADILALGEYLREDKHITSLDFSHCRLNSNGVLVLSKVIARNPNIRTIKLWNCNIGAHGGKYLGDALATNTRLESLFLRDNMLGPQGAVDLANGILKQPKSKLVDLDISNNNIGVVGVNAMDKIVDMRKQTGGKPILINCNGSHLFEEVVNSLTHGVGILLSIVGGYILLVEAYENHSTDYYIACWVFVLSLLVLYTASTLAHSFFRFEVTGNIFVTMDHCAIYILIAGSYTPFAITTLGHHFVGIMLCVVVWVLAAIGVSLSVFGGPEVKTLRLLLTLGMGWMILPVLDLVSQCLSYDGLFLLGLGGAFYTFGVYFYIKGNNRPILHAIWHLAVLGGSICHYLCILWYVRPCHIDYETRLATIYETIGDRLAEGRAWTQAELTQRMFTGGD